MSNMSEFHVYLRGGAPWGFRLYGGKEFRASLRVAKVIDEGKASAAGIQVGDQVLEINGKTVENFFHTEALVAVKKATESLHLKLRRNLRSSTEDSIDIHEETLTAPPKSNVDMIEIKSYNPVSEVPMKPASATSVPVVKPLQDHISTELTYTESYPDYANQRSEWSPHLINELVRTPDPIIIADVNSHAEYSETSLEKQYDSVEAKKNIPQAPLSPLGFNKAKPTGRGRRRLTSSGSSSFDSKENKIDQEQEENKDRFSYKEPVSLDTEEMHYNSALKHLQCNKAKTDNIPRTSSLPRSLGKKIKQGMENKSMTLPRKSSQQTPTWYKDMYKEINKTMEGQSHLSRLLTADAARGAFRDYDGATSPRSLSPNDENRRKQRPKSVHGDRFNFHDFTVQSDSDFKNVPTNLSPAVKRNLDSNAEKREKRHSVHSMRYRDFQKGGDIPAAGLSAASHEDLSDQSSRLLATPSHTRSRSQDDILTSGFNGLPYQRYDEKHQGRQPHDPVKFEYNNPPDFLELRKKAEAEGTLREERERELKMLQEQRKKWLQEEEELRKSSIARQEKEKRRTISEEKRREEEMQIKIQQQREKENQRVHEINERKKEERKREHEKLLATHVDTESVSLCIRGKALYSFHPQTPSELGFKKGDILELKRQIDDNWYEGEFNRQIGIFPASYIEVIEEKLASEPETLEDQSEIFQIEEGSAKARFTFHAENEKELSFRKNDMITHLRKVDENWYEGEIEDRIGIFPVAYVEVLKTPRIMKTSPELGVEMVQPHVAPEISACDRTVREPITNEGEAVLPSVHMDHEELQQNSKIYVPVPNDVFNQPESVANAVTTDASMPSADRHRVVFSYDAQNEDELNLEEGDIISVFEKCDDGWFVGHSERTGMFGIFPGNYVVSI